MNASLRVLIYELVVHHRRVNKISHLSLTDLVAVPELCFDVAKEASKASDKPLSEIGRKVLDALALEGITSGTGVASTSAPSPAPRVASAPAPAPTSAPATAAVVPPSGSGRSYDREWERMEVIAIDEAGPMGSQLLRKVRARNPGIDPATLKSKMAETFGAELATTIFEKYRSR